MKSAEALLSWGLHIECPYCSMDIDLSEMDDDGCYSTPIFNNEWKILEGFEETCPNCKKEFKISSIEY